VQTIFGVFKDFAQADNAVHELQDKHFPKEALNVLVHEQAAKSNLDEVNLARVHVDATDTIGEKELSGLALLVLNERPVTVRGLGPVYAAGQMATILASSATTTDQGGEDAQSILTSYGVTDKTAETYCTTVAGGGVLLWVRSNDQQTSTASEILRRHNAQQVMTNQ
jgi:hypothetical protein